MKRVWAVAIAGCFVVGNVNAQMKIGDNPATINSSSLLELESTNKGFVLPRVSLTTVSSYAPLNAGLITGTIVYNTNAAVTGGAGAGLYTWNGTQWGYLLTNTGSSSLSWLLSGNSSTNPSVNFLGTTDNNSLSFRTNNIRRLLIDSLGKVGIGSYAFDAANPEKILIDYGSTTSNTIMTLKGNTPTYLQVNIQNQSTNSNASADYVATADNGTDSTNYIDMGINNSGYSAGPDYWGGPNDGYLYTNSRHLLIGTQNNSSDIMFLVAGGSIKNNTALRIVGPSGVIIIGKGEASTTPVGNILRGPNAAATSTNVGGGDLTIKGGSATGTATGGSVNITGGTSTGGNAGSVNINISANFATNIGTGIGTQNISIGGNNNNILLPKLNTAGGIIYTAASTGQIASTTAGTAGQLLVSTGGAAPAWASGSNYFWQLTGNVGITAPTAAIGSAVNNNFIGTTDAKDFVLATNNLERLRISSAGYIGIGTTSPSYSLQVMSASNPLFLSGVQPTATFSSDSILTIYNGVVKKAPYSSLPSGGGSGWLLTGNSIAAGSFLGTTNNQPLIIKVNNGQVAYHDGNSNIIYGQVSPSSITGSNNLGIGYQVMNGANSGNNNIAVGQNTMSVNSGSYNIATGYKTMSSNSGSYNIAVGDQTLNANNGGNYNLAMGYQSMNSTNTGNYNIAIGQSAMNINSGSNNIALGSNSLTGNTGNYNLGIGSTNLASNKGSYNIAIGDLSLNTNSNGANYNLAMGNQSMNGTNTGSNNLAFGSNAMNTNSGNNNAAFGTNALTGNTGSYNLGIGNTALGTNKGSYNLAVGDQAMNANNAGGNYNLAFGQNTLNTNSGLYNIAMGYQTMGNNKGSYNIGLGDQSLAANANGANYNLAMGYQVMNGVNSGSNNIAVGQNTLNVNSGSYNLAIGYSAMTSNKGSYNFGLGDQALNSNSNAANYNLAMGYQAMNGVNSGSNNIAFGQWALNTNSGSYNLGFGYQALYTNQGGYNFAFGQWALKNNTSGNFNFAFGYNSLTANTGGVNNIALGSSSLATNTTGNYNIAIGQNADVSNSALNNATAIGYNAKVGVSNATAIGYNAAVSTSSASTNAVVIGSTTANVGIGTASPNTNANLDVNGTFKLGAVGTVQKNEVTFSGTVNTTVTAAYVINLLGGIATSTNAMHIDVTITIPATLTGTQGTVSVSPAFDLPAGVSVASARIISTTQVKIRFLNAGTSTQTVSGTLYIKVNEF